MKVLGIDSANFSVALCARRMTDKCLICGKEPIISPPFCATCEIHAIYDRQAQTVFYLGRTYTLEYLLRHGPLLKDGQILPSTFPLTKISEDFIKEAQERIAVLVIPSVPVLMGAYSISKPWIVIAEHWEAYIAFCHENCLQPNDPTKTIFAQPTKIRGLRFKREQIAYAGRFWLNRSFDQIRDEIESVLGPV